MTIETFFEMGTTGFVFAILVSLLAGFVKGAVGFGLPLVMVAGLASFLTPEIVVAGLVFPALLTNIWQATRQGPRAAWSASKNHWLFILVMLVCIFFSAQYLTSIPQDILFLVLGIPVTVLASIMLTGWSPKLKETNKAIEILLGASVGGIGGLSGVWGPQTALYFAALQIEKQVQIRLQGVIYGCGALMLTVAHFRSGVLSGAGLNLSLALITPAMIGLAFGFMLQDKLDQTRFQRLTLIVLVIAGLNLVRRALY